MRMKMQSTNKPTTQVIVRLLVFAVLLTGCITISARGESTSDGTIGSARPSSTTLGVVERVCELIYHGKFGDADKILQNSAFQSDSPPAELLKLTHEYDAINNRREDAKKTIYSSVTTELEDLKRRSKISNVSDVNDPNDLVDLNDVNDIIEILATISENLEYADSTQKQKILSDSFVTEVIQNTIDKAAELEVEGKWLEAYTSCYRWLKAIDPNNQGYSDHADELLDRAAIEISFEDSPCETREERYSGVEEKMFVRAVNFLSAYYVRIPEYDQMATKAIERCKMLSEVMEKSPILYADSKETMEDSTTKSAEDLWEPNQFAAWQAVLDALLAEVKEASNGPFGFNKDKFLYVMDKVIELNKTTVDFPQNVLISHFVEAALTALDPYTSLVWPKQVQDFEKIMTNQFTGIGIEISKQEGLLTVASLLPDTPAYASGLDAGDVIEKVNGIETKDMSLTCAVHKITGPRGTKVTLTIKSPNEEKRKEITITRDRIVVPTIRGWQRTNSGKWSYMIEPRKGIGYVRLTSFSGDTADDLEKVLLKLEADGLRGLILDLRFNTGGLLDSAVEVADKFIEADDWVVKRQPRPGIGPSYEPSHVKGTHPNYPMVILINYSSASASEIVAGALADKKFNRATLVGGRTHGKGSVQGVTSYPGGGAQLKYTMAYYHLPSDQRVESQEAMKKLGRKDWGVGPDVEVVLRSDELKKMLEVQRDNDVLVREDHDTTDGDIKKYSIEETLASDPQLAVGLLVIKSKMIEAEALARAWLNL